MKQIADNLGCSTHKVSYWIHVHGIARRSRADAGYLRKHPDGDPFKCKEVSTLRDSWLQGMGLGLFWGEGNKVNKHVIRLGNTDPALLRMFIMFLTELYGVKREDLRYGVQIFSDLDVNTVMRYWQAELDAKPSQFYKPTITISGKVGTYRKKSLYGVATVYYANRKLRDTIVGQLPR